MWNVPQWLAEQPPVLPVQKLSLHSPVFSPFSLTLSLAVNEER